ncbi:MaoC family dehydratase [Propionivibrio dicarboxylicus]|uniref:3-hydroxybutyryl-CoA dehydratase n=1 Tax=Propionivibrio dicarboxylicus TaxID=83767 RepID=A0A1G8IYG4_9RHOO|nr:MaoC family dehydratase [Propionivibrio dicarboxylicus]SDI23767.1 3-hydroxybutyryl-CoA dehydratase [Propionivibrio dicarboxylicus]
MFDPATHCGEVQLGLTINQIKVGDTASFGKTLTEADAYQFSGIIGNFNPIHVNKEFCASIGLGKRVVPSMLVASMVSKILGTQLPGNGTVHVAQEMEFLQPVFIGDTVTCHVEVSGVDGKAQRVRLDIACTNQQGEVVARGESEAIPPACAKGRP